MQDSDQEKPRNKEKEPVVPDNVDTPAGDELSLGSSLDLSPAKSSKAKSFQRHSHRPTFSNANGGAYCRAGRETGQG